VVSKAIKVTKKNKSVCTSICTPTNCTSTKLCSDKKCVKCYNRRLSEHERVIYFSKKNKSDPKLINVNSRKQCYFDCPTCKKSYRIAVQTFIKKSQISWCRNCPNKTELKLHEWLIKIYGSLGVQKHVKFDWCINKDTSRHLPFDFYIEDLNLIIELDGKYHFKPVRRWKQNIKHIRERDIYKMNNAIEHGFTLIRILQDDVWYDKRNWEKDLVKNIKFYNEPTKIFICSNDEYKGFK
jgi:hypothetical protein